MARHLRCNVQGGWYHITTRGVGRRVIFEDDGDREHFIGLLGELVSRYGIILHAYVLMDNHYHLLIETPEGNASRALQWLNVSYANWFNALHGYCGQFFQGRYKSIPVENDGSWALTCSVYLHLNPVRIQALGQGKAARAAERAGAVSEPPTQEMITRRLAVLRGHAWSSYPAYAGYAVGPTWLTRKSLWHRVARKVEEAPAAYRCWIEDYLRQGVEEGVGSHLTQALAIGSTAFVEKLRKKMAAVGGTRTNARAWRRLLSFRDVVRAVEAEVGEAWSVFGCQRGDWRRDLVLGIGRMQGGMTLAELATHADMSLDTVAKAVKRMRTRLTQERSLRMKYERILRGLNEQPGDS